MAPRLKEKPRIRHIMDLKRPRLLVPVIGAVLCAALGVLLLVNPGQRGNQLEGVEMAVVRAMDRGIPVDLPADMARELVRLIRVYDKGDYNDLSSYRPAPEDIYLSDRHGGTVYYLTGSLDSVPVLVRINHDGYGWTSAFEGLTLTGMDEDPAYRIWAYRLEEYLTAGRAEALYEMRTPYIGNHVACGEILKALNVSQAAGPYTIELRTEKEPYGITLHLENCPALEEERAGNTRYLRQAGTLFTALVDNASFFNWDYVDAPKGVTGAGIQPGLKKPVDREAFQVLYDSFRQTVGEAVGPERTELGRYSLGEALYLSPEMPWRDMPMYLGNVTVARDVFSVQMSHVLSSAMPQINDMHANPVYCRADVPEELVLKDDAWPSQQYLELVQAQEPPLAKDGVLPLTVFTDRSCLEVRDTKGNPTPYRLYRLDGALWLSHETGGEADWVFTLTEQPESPPPTDEAE